MTNISFYLKIVHSGTISFFSLVSNRLTEKLRLQTEEPSRKVFLINSVSFIFINLSLLIQRAVAILKYFFTLFFILSNFWKDRIEDLASSCLSTPSVRKIRASFFQVTHFLCAPAPLGNFQLD